ncbi:MAG: inositol monophosphatase [Actinomycetota bacterium]|nr:inositol monophosphatase [Actinomycetota bacterium]
MGELLEMAMMAASSAADILLDFYEAPAQGVRSKSTATDLVSDADRAAEKFLLDFFRHERPEDGILAEEGGGRSSTSGITWVIDPLDGTINFLFGIPVWCVSIAAQDAEGELVGVVYDPNREEMFAAERGEGATVNGEAVQVSQRDELSTALIGTGFSYDADARAHQAELLSRVLPRVRDVRRAGSAAIDLATLACGRFDGFYEAPMEPWDKAAGVLLVREAGGIVSDLPAPKGLSSGVVAAGPKLHDALRAAVVQ